MKKYITHFALNLFVGSLRVLAAKESGFVTAHRPIKPVGGAPALLRRHSPKHRNLFRTGLFIRQHVGNLPGDVSVSKEPVRNDNENEEDMAQFPFTL